MRDVWLRFGERETREHFEPFRVFRLISRASRFILSFNTTKSASSGKSQILLHPFLKYVWNNLKIRLYSSAQLVGWTKP
jgi:hypothetical protein